MQHLAQARLLDAAESRQARLRHAGIGHDVAHDGGAIQTKNMASGALCPDQLSIPHTDWINNLSVYAISMIK